MSPTRVIALSALVVVLVAGCGDDDGDDRAPSNVYSDALAENLGARAGDLLDADGTDCLAREFVDAVGGPPAFDDAGVTPEDLATADNIADDFDIELGEDAVPEIAQAFRTCDISIADKTIELLGAQAGDEVRECVAANLDEEAMVEAYAAALAAGEELGLEVFASIEVCFDGGG